MTPKEKAEEIYNQFIAVLEIKDLRLGTNPYARECSYLIVNQIESALTNYGNETHELQNMDSEFRYWDSVREELENM